MAVRTKLRCNVIIQSRIYTAHIAHRMKSGELCRAAFCQADQIRLNIPVRNPLRMCVLKRGCKLFSKPEHILFRAGKALLIDALCQTITCFRADQIRIAFKKPVRFNQLNLLVLIRNDIRTELQPVQQIGFLFSPLDRSLNLRPLLRIGQVCFLRNQRHDFQHSFL